MNRSGRSQNSEDKKSTWSIVAIQGQQIIDICLSEWKLALTKKQVKYLLSSTTPLLDKAF